MIVKEVSDKQDREGGERDGENITDNFKGFTQTSG